MKQMRSDGLRTTLRNDKLVTERGTYIFDLEKQEFQKLERSPTQPHQHGGWQMDRNARHRQADQPGLSWPETVSETYSPSLFQHKTNDGRKSTDIPPTERTHPEVGNGEAGLSWPETVSETYSPSLFQHKTNDGRKSTDIPPT
ncbi:hypothetical protein ACOMHN_066260 [Nucella lapillus]